MNIFALIFLLVTAASELLFCVLKLELPAKIVQLLIAPALLLCFLSMNYAASDPWIVGALFIETVFNAFLASKKLSKNWADLALVVAVALFTTCYYVYGCWAFVAPHINFTVFLVYITLLIIFFFRIYTSLPEGKVIKTLAILLYMCAFSACGTIGVLYNFNAGTLLIAAGALLALVHYTFTQLISKNIFNLKFGEFGSMAFYISSRILLVFGFQLLL